MGAGRFIARRGSDDSGFRVMPELPKDMRLILAHKQSTSARVRFLCFAHGISAFEPLPPLSSFDEATPAPHVVHHPAVYLRAAQAILGLPDGSLKHEPEFVAYVVTPDELIAVCLAVFTSIDRLLRLQKQLAPASSLLPRRAIFPRWSWACCAMLIPFWFNFKEQ